MTDKAHLNPPQELFKPEYPGDETHPSVHLDERIEPWLVATTGFLRDHEFSYDLASGRRYDAPTMRRSSTNASSPPSRLA